MECTDISQTGCYQYYAKNTAKIIHKGLIKPSARGHSGWTLLYKINGVRRDKEVGVKCIYMCEIDTDKGTKKFPANRNR